MSGLAAGDLTRKVRVEARPTGKDALNQPLDGPWTPVWEGYAQVKGATGMASIRQASMEGGVPRAIKSYSFRIRYRTDLTEGMRVVMDGAYFNILQIRLDYEGRVWTDLVCETGGTDG